ncbi:MAG: hypothetical protein HPY45_10255 [Anaerolineae bacterium]|nr:hypothetical protein [Anaerolineae bacterium]
MEKIRDQLRNPVVTAILGFLIGLVIGLPVLGWGLLPVRWTDASAQHLREDARLDYLRMAVESYSKNRNVDLAKMRWEELGTEAQSAMQALQSEVSVSPQDIADFQKAVGEAGGGVLEVTPQQTGTSLVTQEPAKESSPGLNLVLLFGVFCVLTLVVGAVLVFIILQRRKRVQSGDLGDERAATEDGYGYVAEEAGYVEGQEHPIAQFMTTYTLGDDLYDDSFSIDSPTGEFLGECGVGVSDTIGIGDPKKVSAFEVWLFDKNDIQTVTKVLMSEHAYNNPEIKQRLATKGEPVLLESGKHILLDTATLQLEARVVDMNYGQGALPQNSFFERLTLELAIWPKAVE